MKSNLVSILLAAILAALPCAAMADDVALDESVTLDGGAVTAPADVPLERAPSLDTVASGNTAEALLSRHSSLAGYALNYNYVDGQTIERESMTALMNNGSGITLYETNDALAFVYDGDNRYLIYPDGSAGVNLCFDDELKAYYDAYISEFALYTSHEGETLTSCQYLNGQYMLIATISHGDYANATGQSFDFDDSVPLITTLTVDAKTLELYSWQTVARIADGIEIPLSNGSVVYDSTALPDQYYAMADPLATRTITIISDPDTAYAAEQTFTIADSAQPYVIAPDGYVLTVKHGDQYIEPEYPETAAPGNLTFYLIPDA